MERPFRSSLASATTQCPRFRAKSRRPLASFQVKVTQRCPAASPKSTKDREESRSENKPEEPVTLARGLTRRGLEDDSRDDDAVEDLDSILARMLRRSTRSDPASSRPIS